MGLIKKVFFIEVKEFMKKHNLGTDLKIYPGYFISPTSVQNLKEKGRKQAIFLDMSLIQLYELKWKGPIEALEYFLRLNRINANLNDSDVFNTYMALLSYMMALHKGNFHYPELTDAERKWELVSHHLTPGNVKDMYISLQDYLKKKGLTDSTITSIIYNNRIESHEGFNNCLAILNMIADMHQTDAQRNENYLIRDIGMFRKAKPLSNNIGEVMEKVVRSNKDHIKGWLMSRFHSSHSLLLDFDSDKEIHGKIKGKVPDFFYIDDRLNVCGLDSKVALEYANPLQVSSQILSQALEKIDFIAELQKL